MSFKTISQSQLGQQTAKNSEIVTSSIIVFNSGGGSDVGGPTISNVVVTDSNYVNTFGSITVSGSYVKIFGTGFVSNTTVLVNANSVPVTNVTFTSSTELRVALPTIANNQTVQFNTINAGAPKFTVTGPGAPQTYSVNYLVVAGGGGGSRYFGGGGGGGGLLQGSISLTPATTYTITVGRGGAPGPFNTSPAEQGGNSCISGGSISTITAIGGGGGGIFCNSPLQAYSPGRTGGSGGGGGGYNGAVGGPAGVAIGTTAPDGTSPVTPGIQGSQGWPGGHGKCLHSGGGGGAGGVGGSRCGSVAGSGGIGYTWPFTANTYAGGGGGGGSTTAGTGGPGGGGPGGQGNGLNGTDGTPGRGGGGGGAGPPGGTRAGGVGGSGVVILVIPTAAYPTVSAPGAIATNPPAAPGATVLTYNAPATANTTYTFIA
jgi:hypothetical protein